MSSPRQKFIEEKLASFKERLDPITFGMLESFLQSALSEALTKGQESVMVEPKPYDFSIEVGTPRYVNGEGKWGKNYGDINNMTVDAYNLCIENGQQAKDLFNNGDV